MRNATPQEKINRAIARYPQVRQALDEAYKDNRKYLTKTLERVKYKKAIILTETDKSSQVLLACIMNYGVKNIKLIPTYKLLDSYLNEEDETPLSQIVSDIVILKDNRAYVPNKQKGNFITQVFEQNEICYLCYKGSLSQIKSDIPEVLSYAQSNNIHIFADIKEVEEEVF